MINKRLLFLIFILSASFAFFIERYFFFNSNFQKVDAQKEIENIKYIKSNSNLENKKAGETVDVSKIKKELYLTEEEYQALAKEKQKEKVLEVEKSKSKNTAKKNENKNKIAKKDKYDYSQPIIWPVFFTSQAPSGQWNNEIFQDGCEEAAMLMAINWARDNNKKLSTQDVEKEILNLTNFEKEKYGFYLDVSIRDVCQVIKDYYHYFNIKLIEKVTSDELIRLLYDKAVIIIPVNGQLLHNPYFTPPGPAYHSLVIIGYDPIQKVFITNDPGTKRGKQYRYPRDILYKAIRNYPSGYHQTVKNIQKSAVVVYK